MATKTDDYVASLDAAKANLDALMTSRPILAIPGADPEKDTLRIAEITDNGRLRFLKDTLSKSQAKALVTFIQENY